MKTKWAPSSLATLMTYLVWYCITQRWFYASVCSSPMLGSWHANSCWFHSQKQPSCRKLEISKKEHLLRCHYQVKDPAPACFCVSPLQFTFLPTLLYPIPLSPPSNLHMWPLAERLAHKGMVKMHIAAAPWTQWSGSLAHAIQNSVCAVSKCGWLFKKNPNLHNPTNDWVTNPNL